MQNSVRYNTIAMLAAVASTAVSVMAAAHTTPNATTAGHRSSIRQAGPTD